MDSGRVERDHRAVEANIHRFEKEPPKTGEGSRIGKISLK